MTEAPHPRSRTISRLLSSARARVRSLDRALTRLEHLNADAPRERGDQAQELQRLQARACFVLSTGRTGTQSLASLLGRCPDMDAHHEPEPRLIASSYLAWAQPSDPQGFWEQALGVARDPLVLSAHRRGKVYFEGNNRMTLLLEPLANRYPQARFLFVVREPIGFVNSALRRGYYQGHPWDFARLRPQAQDPAHEGWEQLAPKDKCIWLWSATNTFALDRLEKLAPSRWQLLWASDLFEANTDRLTQVLNFAGASQPMSPGQIRSHLQRPRNQQVGTFAKGVEPNWAPGEQEALLESLEPLLTRLRHVG